MTNNQPAGYQWTSHPVAENPGRTWIVAVFVLLTAAALWLGTRDVYWTVFGPLVVLAGAAEWFLPTRYRLDETGATRRFLLATRRRDWAAIRRVRVDARGVLLSPYPSPTRLDAFRGLYLRFAGNREAVLAFVAEHVPWPHGD
jgi:hypothetical protein